MHVSAAFVVSGCHLTSPPQTLILDPQVSSSERNRTVRYCPCGRRHLLESAAAAAMLPVLPLKAAIGSPSDPKDAVDKFHPSRSDWYEEFYAKSMKESMRLYEAETAGYKAELFNHLTGKSKNILELGVGTGPNFRYYASVAGLNVFGVDPNKRMEKYARAEAVAAGLPLTNFNFMRGVGEALPVRDNSMDAVIGTLVLCSVKDVGMVLMDGSLLRCVQSILDPLQNVVADGCHLTRETGKQILEAGFSSVRLNMAFISTFVLISPHIYGIVCK